VHIYVCILAYPHARTQCEEGWYGTSRARHLDSWFSFTRTTCLEACGTSFVNMYIYIYADCDATGKLIFNTSIRKHKHNTYMPAHLLTQLWTINFGPLGFLPPARKFSFEIEKFKTQELFAVFVEYLLFMVISKLGWVNSCVATSAYSKTISIHLYPTTTTLPNRPCSNIHLQTVQTCANKNSRQEFQWKGMPVSVLPQKKDLHNSKDAKATK